MTQVEGTRSLVRIRRTTQELYQSQVLTKCRKVSTFMCYKVSDDIKKGLLGKIIGGIKFPAKFKEKYAAVHKDTLVSECNYWLRKNWFCVKLAWGHTSWYTCSEFLFEIYKVRNEGESKTEHLTCCTRSPMSVLNAFGRPYKWT